MTGWNLHADNRRALLGRFPPEWPDILADHITLASHVERDAPLPTAEAAAIVGTMNDGEGLQAMAVAIEGTTERPDGSIYHITWSLHRRRGRTPIESNSVLGERSWHRFEDPVPIRIRPARWP